jgi:hypothetical protein
MTKDANDTSKGRQLEARLERLEKLFCGLAESGTIGNTLGQGLEAIGKVSDRLDLIATQLAPLRRLEGSAVVLDEQQQQVLARLVAALDRSNFTNVRSLPVKESPVPFIGDIQERREIVEYLPDRSTST